MVEEGPEIITRFSAHKTAMRDGEISFGEAIMNVIKKR
jgi:hypothetical protein